MGEETTPEERLALAEQLWDWRPHDGQLTLLTLRLPNGLEPKVLVAACGRRWGKTKALSMDVAARLLTEPDLCQLLVAPTRDQAEGLFDAVEEKLLAVQEDPAKLARFPHAADLVVKRAPFAHVRRKTDGAAVLIARCAGRNGRNLRGKGTTRRLRRFRVVIDEAAYVADEAVERAIRPMLATVPGGGGQMVLISSPAGRRGHFYRAYLKGEQGAAGHRAVRLPSSQNPLVDPEYLDEMRQEMTDRAFAAEFLAEFVDSAGAVFPEDDIAACLCDEDEEVNRGATVAELWGRRYVAGVDFARRGDYTVVAVLEAGVGPNADGCRLVELLRLRGLGWGAQIERIGECLARWECAAVVTDGTGNGDAPTEALAEELAKRRLRCAVERFVFTSASKAGLIDALVIALARRRLRFPPHPDLLAELRAFEAVPAALPGGRERLEAAHGGHDDCVCALALALRAAAPWLSAAHTGAAALDVLRATPGRSPLGRGKDAEIDFAGGAPPRRSLRARLASRLLDALYATAPGRRFGRWLAARTRR
jgi:phage FluMu gp28-like protein